MASGEFSVEVHAVLPVVEVRAGGRADGSGANDLRAALRIALAGEPAGVLVEASRLEVADDEAVAVIVAAARDSERWPGVPIALSGPPAILANARRLGLERFLLLCPDTEAARAELDTWRGPPSRRERISPSRDAPAIARSAVRDFCAQHHVPADTAQLVTSELVTNAVLHAGTQIELSLRLIGARMHIAVRDGNARPPRIASNVDEYSESGRGLLLVDALAVAWGYLIPDNGKVVWATVPLPNRSELRRHPFI